MRLRSFDEEVHRDHRILPIERDVSGTIGVVALRESSMAAHGCGKTILHASSSVHVNEASLH
jgi:hypothetical protein